MFEKTILIVSVAVAVYNLCNILYRQSAYKKGFIDGAENMANSFEKEIKEHYYLVPKDDVDGSFHVDHNKKKLIAKLPFYQSN